MLNGSVCIWLGVGRHYFIIMRESYGRNFHMLSIGKYPIFIMHLPITIMGGLL
jgi:hypothetical protein